jgi:NitT/TauT family transport system substrate-binding protein
MGDKMRNNKHKSLAISLALLILVGCSVTPTPSPTPTPALTPITIGLGYKPDVQFAPFYVAANKGYYRAEGLDVTFQNGNVPDLMKVMAGGDASLQFVAASGDEVIPARVQGIPVLSVMTWYTQYPVAAASIVGKGPELKKPEDLKGQTVGVPGPFGATYIGLQALLKAGGMTMDDVTIKTIGFTQVENLSQGQVDVAMVYAANEPVQLRSKNLEVSTLMTSDYINLASNCLAASDKAVKENPDLVRKVVRATLKGIQDTISDPKGAFEESLKQVPEAGSAENRDLQMKVLEETVKLMQPAANQPLGWTDPELWSATQDFLLEAKLIPQAADVNTMFTNEFIEK